MAKRNAINVNTTANHNTMAKTQTQRKITKHNHKSQNATIFPVAFARKATNRLSTRNVTNRTNALCVFLKILFFLCALSDDPCG